MAMNLSFLSVVALAMAVLAFAGDTSKPHIVLFVVDDLGYADIGYHGSEYATPNIDRLATTGVRLERYYVQPVCSPTRSTFMTGRDVHHTGFYTVLQKNTHAHLPASPTLAEQLRDVGYKTHMLGKWHLGYDTWNATPIGRGFSTHFGYFQGAQDYYTKYSDGSFDFWDNTRPAYENQGGYSLTQYMDRAKKLIAEHDKSEPLFLYFAHQTIHAPIQGLPDYLKTKYAPSCSNSTNALRFTYCTMMAYLDDTLQDFVDSLLAASMWDNTLMLVTTDNGGMVQLSPFLPDKLKGAGCNFPLRGGKATTFEGGVRGVAFVQGGFLPKDVRGSIQKGLMQSTDVYSTLLSLAGVKSLPSDVDGIDQSAMILKGEKSKRTSVILSVQSLSGSPAIIEDDMKLIEGSSPIDGYWSCADQKKHRVPMSGWPHGWVHGTMLFNLTADPIEEHNLAASMPDRVARLQKLLAEAAATAVPAQPTDVDSRGSDFSKSHNNTLFPWSDDKRLFSLVV